MRSLNVIVAVCGLVLAAPGSAFTQGGDGEGPMRARIGIQVTSGDRTVRAGARERLRAGDRIRIWVAPEAPCRVYVVHADETRVSLLNDPEAQVFPSALSLPPDRSHYTVDGESRLETVTVLVCPAKMPEMEPLESGRMTVTAWGFLHDYLLRRSSLLTTREEEKPFAIAGNVRGAADPCPDDAFVRGLPLYSGRGLLVKDYAFMVQK
jgi:hypothetical protein